MFIATFFKVLLINGDEDTDIEALRCLVVLFSRRRTVQCYPAGIAHVADMS